MADSQKGNKEYTVIIGQVPPSKKKTDYGWMKEQVSPSHFCKVVVVPNLGLLPVLEAFRPYLGELPAKIRLETNTGCVWTIHLNEFNGRACLDRGWAPFASAHGIRMGYQLLFKQLAPKTFRVIIFDTTGVEISKDVPSSPGQPQDGRLSSAFMYYCDL